jgi:glutamate-1-semialdehyde 2,1-aminomutase
VSHRYTISEKMLKRSLETIPLGTQTFSKSKTQYPLGISPYFAKKARGSHIWDVDDNEYVDFISSLCSINLGYSDPDIDQAVSDQLKEGIIFSLPHPIEFKVSEKIVEMVPCAEMVRFGKNGSDATAGAIRLARAHTRRDHVAVCGYHGWQDWYIGSTLRNRGVPKVTQELTHTFKFNDLDSLQKIFKQWPDQVAAVILEPMNVVEPKDGFLEGVKELTHKNGALLIFDETITGFRYANGGAQELFGVTPDLATFGKGMANGYPVSAVTGKAEIMRLMEEIFFSFTFGGEALSLAAALATMIKLQKQPVTQTLAKQGRKVMESLNELIVSYRLEDIFSVSGHPSWSFLMIKDKAPYTSWQIKTLMMQEFFEQGILAYGSHNMNYSHGDEDLKKLSKGYDRFFKTLKDAFENRSLEEKLKCKPLEPLFKVR